MFRNSADEGLYLGTIRWCRFVADLRQMMWVGFSMSPFRVPLVYGKEAWLMRWIY